LLLDNLGGTGRKTADSTEANQSVGCFNFDNHKGDRFSCCTGSTGRSNVRVFQPVRSNVRNVHRFNCVVKCTSLRACFETTPVGDVLTGDPLIIPPGKFEEGFSGTPQV
jgi:hypothetical protein